MYPDNTHFLCLSGLYPSFTTSTLNLTRPKRKNKTTIPVCVAYILTEP